MNEDEVEQIEVIQQIGSIDQKHSEGEKKLLNVWRAEVQMFIKEWSENYIYIVNICSTGGLNVNDPRSVMSTHFLADAIL